MMKLLAVWPGPVLGTFQTTDGSCEDLETHEMSCSFKQEPVCSNIHNTLRGTPPVIARWNKDRVTDLVCYLTVDAAVAAQAVWQAGVDTGVARQAGELVQAAGLKGEGRVHTQLLI